MLTLPTLLIYHIQQWKSKLKKRNEKKENQRMTHKTNQMANTINSTGSSWSIRSISHDDIHNQKQKTFKTIQMAQILEHFIDNCLFYSCELIYFSWW